MNRIALTLAVLLGLAACAPRGGTQPAPAFYDQHEPSTSQGVFPPTVDPTE